MLSNPQSISAIITQNGNGYEARLRSGVLEADATDMVAWDPVTHADVVRAIYEYDRLGPEAFFSEHGFAPTATDDLVRHGRCYPPKAILGTACEVATAKRLASGDLEGGKSAAVAVLGKLGFTAGIVVSNLLPGNNRTPNYQGIPTVVFTTPPLARVGLSGPAAAAQGLRFRTRYEDTTSWYSSRRVSLAHTGYKTLVEETTGRILGAHLLGPHAEEVINIIGFAIRHGLRADDLTDMVYTYPTNSSDIKYMM